MLSGLHIKWLDSRGISAETATHMGVYSAKQDQDGQYVPSLDGAVLTFPFLKDGEEVGAKYRGPQKRFWQKAGGRKQFWNRDVLMDPALQDAETPLVIVEGEMDALAVVQSGYPFVVSVPDGAPPARDANGVLIDVPEDTKDIDPAADAKFAFLLTDWELLAQVKRIVIAVDADEPGRRLAAELVRRLDRVRCCFINMPDDCKDLNDVLTMDGPQKVLEIIQTAKPYPVEGIYRASDFPPVQALQTFSTGWKSVDEIMRPYLSCFMVVGGFPGHGKSTWTMQLATNMAALHGWTVAIASFEMQIVPYVTNALMTAYLGKNIKNAAPQNRTQAELFLEKRFVFIAPNRGDSETEHDIDWLLDRLQTSVIREGVRMILVDPFNEIEHRKRADESMTEYIGRAIRKLKAFAMQYDVLVVVVVHPTKSSAQMDSSELSLYSLADSSHWANKADIGVIVGRMGDPQIDSLTGIYIKKIRYQPDAGSLGQAILHFDRDERLFVE